MSTFCPNINHPDFIKLESDFPLEAYSLFNKYQGDINAIYENLGLNTSEINTIEPGLENFKQFIQTNREKAVDSSINPIDKIIGLSTSSQKSLDASISSIKRDLNAEEYKDFKEYSFALGLQITDDLSGFSVNHTGNKNKLSNLTNKIIELTNNQDNVFVISKEEFLKKYPKKNIEGLKSIVLADGKIFIFENASEEIQLEEVLHPIILNLSVNDKVKFNLFLKEVKELYPELVEEIKNSSVYSKQSKLVQDNEIVTKGLVKVLQNKQALTNTAFYKKVLDFVARFFKKMLGGYYFEHLGHNSNTLTIKLFAETIQNGNVNFDILNGIELYSADTSKEAEANAKAKRAASIINSFINKKQGLIKELRAGREFSPIIKQLQSKTLKQAVIEENDLASTFSDWLTKSQNSFLEEAHILYEFFKKNKDTNKAYVTEFLYLKTVIENLKESLNTYKSATNTTVDLKKADGTILTVKPLEYLGNISTELSRIENDLLQAIINEETSNVNNIDADGNNLTSIVDEGGNLINFDNATPILTITSGSEAGDLKLQAMTKSYYQLRDRISKKYEEFNDRSNSTKNFLKGKTEAEKEALYEAIMDQDSKDDTGKPTQIINKTTQEFRKELKRLYDEFTIKKTAKDFKAYVEFLKNVLLLDNPDENKDIVKQIVRNDSVNFVLLNIIENKTSKDDFVNTYSAGNTTKSKTKVKNHLRAFYDKYIEGKTIENGEIVDNGKVIDSNFFQDMLLDEDFPKSIEYYKTIINIIYGDYKFNTYLDRLDIADNNFNVVKNNYYNVKFRALKNNPEVLAFYNNWLGTMRQLSKKVYGSVYIDIYQIPNIPNKEGRQENESMLSYAKRVVKKIAYDDFFKYRKINKSDSPLGIGFKLRNPVIDFKLENRSLDFEHIETVFSYNIINFAESKRVEENLILLYKSIENQNYLKKRAGDNTVKDVILKNETNSNAALAIMYDLYGVTHMNEDKVIPLTENTDKKEKALNKLEESTKSMVDILTKRINSVSTDKNLALLTINTIKEFTKAVPSDETRGKLYKALFQIIARQSELFSDLDSSQSIISNNIAFENLLNDYNKTDKQFTDVEMKSFSTFIQKSLGAVNEVTKQTLLEELVQYAKDVNVYSNSSFKKNLSLNQTLDKVINYTRLLGLGFSLTGGIYEMLQGGQALLIEGAGGRYFTAAQASATMKEIGKHLFNGQERKKISKMLDYFNYGDNFLTQDSNWAEKLAFKPYEYSGFFLSASFIKSIINGGKYNPTYKGVEYKLNDIFEFTANGVNIKQAELDPDQPNITLEEKRNREKFLEDIRYKVYQIIKANRDRNRAMDPTYGSKSYWRLLLTFKDIWLGEGINTRFSAKKFHIGKGEWVEGFYRGSLRAFSKETKYINPVTGEEEIIKQFSWDRVAKSAMAYSWLGSIFKEKSEKSKEELDLDELTEYNLKRATMEIQLILFWMTLVGTLLTVMDIYDDDDEELGTGQKLTRAGLQALLNVANRADRDMSTYTSAISISSFFKDTAPALNTVVNVVKLGKDVVKTATGDAYIYDDTSREQLRLWNSIKKVVPGLSKINSYVNFVSTEIKYD